MGLGDWGTGILGDRKNADLGIPNRRMELVKEDRNSTNVLARDR